MLPLFLFHVVVPGENKAVVGKIKNLDGNMFKIFNKCIQFCFVFFFFLFIVQKFLIYNIISSSQSNLLICNFQKSIQNQFLSF